MPPPPLLARLTPRTMLIALVVGCAAQSPSRCAGGGARAFVPNPCLISVILNAWSGGCLLARVQMRKKETPLRKGLYEGGQLGTCC